MIPRSGARCRAEARLQIGRTASADQRNPTTPALHEPREQRIDAIVRLRSVPIAPERRQRAVEVEKQCRRWRAPEASEEAIEIERGIKIRTIYL